MRASKASAPVLTLVTSAAFVVSLAACAGDAPTAPSAGQFSPEAGATSFARRSELGFHGSLNATEQGQFDPATNTLAVHLVGTGTATYLGRYTAVLDITVQLPAAISSGGTLTLTAANGDLLTATVSGQAVVTGDIASITESATITGGTGRFAGATGSFTITRSLAQSTGISSGAFEGIISLAK